MSMERWSLVFKLAIATAITSWSAVLFPVNAADAQSSRSNKQVRIDDRFSLLEQQVIEETNRARMYPVAYAKLLEQQLSIASTQVISRSELEETIYFLRSIRSLPPLELSRGMSMGSQDLVLDQGPKGGMGHQGSDRRSFSERLNRYGQWRQGVGENISYGQSTGRDIVQQLIIDQSVSGRKLHRENIFNPDFQKIGVSCGFHAKYGSMCAIAYATAYQEGPPHHTAARPSAPAPTPSHRPTPRSAVPIARSVPSPQINSLPRSTSTQPSRSALTSQLSSTAESRSRSQIQSIPTARSEDQFAPQFDFPTQSSSEPALVPTAQASSVATLVTQGLPSAAQTSTASKPTSITPVLDQDLPTPAPLASPAASAPPQTSPDQKIAQLSPQSLPVQSSQGPLSVGGADLAFIPEPEPSRLLFPQWLWAPLGLLATAAGLAGVSLLRARGRRFESLGNRNLAPVSGCTTIDVPATLPANIFIEHLLEPNSLALKPASTTSPQVVLLSPEARTLFELSLARTIPQPIKERAEMVQLSSQGWQVEQIASHLKRPVASVTFVLTQWQQYGLGGLWNQP